MSKESLIPSRPAFSQAERAFLFCIKNGLSNKQIAEQLNIAVKTVEARKFNLVKKLNLNSTRELLVFSVTYFFNMMIVILTLLPDGII